MIRKFRRWKQDINRIETYKAEAYNKGCDDTAQKFVIQQQEMTEKIHKLTQQNIDTENRLRQQADERVENIESMQSTRCKLCQGNMEEERQRLRRRQNMLADRMARVDELILRLLQHANVIVEEHDTILRSSGRIVSHRNVLMTFRKEVDSIMQDSAPLLSVQLNDISEDKAIDISNEDSKTTSRKSD